MGISKVELYNYKHNEPAFKAKYKLPAKEKHLHNFEQHIAPMYEAYFQQPVGAIFDNGILSVFTGKKDIELFKKMRSLITIDEEFCKFFSQPVTDLVIANKNNKYVKRTVVSTDSVTRNIVIPETEFETLNTFKDLLKRLFGQ